jgi:hypothetical protein
VEKDYFPGKSRWAERHVIHRSPEQLLSPKKIIFGKIFFLSHTQESMLIGDYYNTN